MIDTILTALYFFLPAYFANMAPVVAGTLHLPGYAPVCERIFGGHKSWRGLYAGVLGALLALFIQRTLQEQGLLESYRLLDYTNLKLINWSLLFGLGAIGGDMVKSAAKRWLGKKSGSAWPPFDQLDFVVGALVVVSPYAPLETVHILTLLLATPLLHLLVNVTSYKLGMKDVWW